MDTTKAGQLIAEQMEALERDFGDRDDYRIVGGISIILIEGPEGVTFRTRSNLGNPVMTLGTIRMAEDDFLHAMRNPGRLEGDE